MEPLTTAERSNLLYELTKTMLKLPEVQEWMGAIYEAEFILLFIDGEMELFPAVVERDIKELRALRHRLRSNERYSTVREGMAGIEY